MSEWRVVRRRVGFDTHDPGYYLYEIEDIGDIKDLTRAGSVAKLRELLLSALNKPVVELVVSKVYKEVEHEISFRSQSSGT